MLNKIRGGVFWQSNLKTNKLSAVKRFFTPVICALLLLFMLYACKDMSADYKIDQQERPLPRLQMQPIPFPDTDNPSSLPTLHELQPEFIVNFSTLNPDDKEYAYQWERYEIIFPPEVLEQAQGKTRKMKMSHAVLSDRTLNPNAVKIDDMEIIRTSNFLIPDSEDAKKNASK